MSEPLLAIEAGNSRLKFGLFVPSTSSFYRQNGKGVTKVVDVAGEFPSCRRFLAISVNDPIPWSTLSTWESEGMVIAGSNPKAVDRVLDEWQRFGKTEPIVIRQHSSVPISVDTDAPEKVGIDRLLNGVAANSLRPRHRSAIVIDSGTATTLNFVSNHGIFRGGAILPGLEMSAKALHYYTELLPLLPVADLGGELPIAPGRNTREAMRAGLFWGHVGAIRQIAIQICLNQGLHEPNFDSDVDREDLPWMILTGGGAPVICSQFPGMLAVPSLGMHGLVLTAWQCGQ